MAASVADCHDKEDRGKLVAHAFVGLMIGLGAWWLVAYQLDVFHSYRSWRGGG